MSFLIAAVVIYMLKDRIKDNMRSVSNKAISVYFPDQRIDIVDGLNQEIIGESKEKIYFVEKSKVPVDILNIRRASNITKIEERGKPENVFLYRKKIVLFNKKIEKYHQRHRDISDIMRFNIREFLRYADDAIQQQVSWDGKKGELRNISVAKVYHINIVFQLNEFKEGVQKQVLKKIRVIFDQNGIKRIVEPEITL